MKVCIEFVYIIVLRSEKRTAFEPKLIQILQTLQGYQNFAILLCSSWLGQNLVYNIQLLDEAEQSIEIYKRRADQLFAETIYRNKFGKFRAFGSNSCFVRFSNFQRVRFYTF